MGERPTSWLEARVEWIREVVADGCGLESALHREICASLASGDHDALLGALRRWILLPEQLRLEILERCYERRDAQLPAARASGCANR